MEVIYIKDNAIGERIDSYLAKDTEHSRANIQRLIEEEKILVNNSKVNLKRFLWKHKKYH